MDNMPYIDYLYPQFHRKKSHQPPFWPFFLAVLAMLAIMILLFWHWAGAEEINWDTFTDSEIVEAIGKAENSVKFPYGIKSIDTYGNKEYARKICLNSIRNGRARWIRAGKPDDLIIFIGERYCPPTAHKLNSNWVKLVKYFLNKARAR